MNLIEEFDVNSTSELEMKEVSLRRYKTKKRSKETKGGGIFQHLNLKFKKQ